MALVRFNPCFVLVWFNSSLLLGRANAKAPVEPARNQAVKMAVLELVTNKDALKVFHGNNGGARRRERSLKPSWTSYHHIFSHVLLFLYPCIVFLTSRVEV